MGHRFLLYNSGKWYTSITERQINVLTLVEDCNFIFFRHSLCFCCYYMIVFFYIYLSPSFYSSAITMYYCRMVGLTVFLHKTITLLKLYSHIIRFYLRLSDLFVFFFYIFGWRNEHFSVFCSFAQPSSAVRIVIELPQTVSRESISLEHIPKNLTVFALFKHLKNNNNSFDIKEWTKKRQKRIKLVLWNKNFMHIE